MKVALYARVSTFDQKADSQLLALKEYCCARRLKIFREYVDHGISGNKVRRPQLDELMKDARRRKFDAVVVYRFDRYARSTKHLLESLDEFKSVGCAFISISEAIDFSTPLGEAMFTIVSAIAQLERDIIRERVRVGLRAAVAKGKCLGRPKIRNDEEIRSLRKNGLSLRKISTQLQISLATVQRGLNPHLKMLSSRHS